MVYPFQVIVNVIAFSFILLMCYHLMDCYCFGGYCLGITEDKREGGQEMCRDRGLLYWSFIVMDLY